MSSAETTLLKQAAAFAVFPMAGFSFAVDSHVLQNIETQPPPDGRCLDLADIFALQKPQGARRTLALFDPRQRRFHLTVGSLVRVRDIALQKVQRVPRFIAEMGAMRYAMALIEEDVSLSYVLDTTALASRHREQFG